MKKTMALMLTLMMILTSVSFAAPSMVSTVTTSQEIQAKEQKLPEEQLLLNEDAVNHIDETYGILVFNVDFDTTDDFATLQKLTKQGYANSEFDGYENWYLNVGGQVTADGVTAPEKVVESNGNKFLRIHNGLSQYPQFNVVSGNTTTTKFTTQNGYFTILADIRANISGEAGVDFKRFFTQNYFQSGSSNSNVESKNYSLKSSEDFVTFEYDGYKADADSVNRINYVFAYTGNPTIKNVDSFDIDNVRLYIKPFSVDFTVIGNESVKDATFKIDIPAESKKSVYTKSELLGLVNAQSSVRYTDLTLEDGSSFEKINIVEVNKVKGVPKIYQVNHPAYGTLLYDIDFETEDDFVTGQHPSKQGYVNPDFAEDTWTLVASSSTGISEDVGYKPVKDTENGNTFLRMYSGLATNMSLQVRTNGTSDGFFTDENGYYTVFADVKATVSGNAGQNYKHFFMQPLYPGYNTALAHVATIGDWAESTAMVSKANETALRRISYHFGYEGKTTTKNVDVFEIDNIKLYFKPFTKDVTILAGNNEAFEAQKVTVAIDKDLDSTITKAELMALVENDTDMILADLTLSDGSAFEEIDVMTVAEVKTVWQGKEPESYNVASIRVNNPAGIRFRASVTTKQKAVATEYGFIVTLENHLGGMAASEFTHESDITKVIGVSYGYDPKAEKDVDRIYETDGNKIFFTAALYGMPNEDASYRKNIIVRPYLKDTDGTYYYGTPVVRSVLDVAIAIRDGGYEKVGENGKEYVQNILTVCGEEI